MNRANHVAGSLAAPDISIEQGRLLEPVCNAFEASWRAGKRVDIAVAIAELPEELRLLALKELISLDIFYRRKAGESPQSRDYADRFPDLDE